MVLLLLSVLITVSTLGCLQTDDSTIRRLHDSIVRVISEKEVLRRALQNEDIKEFAEGKDLIFLIFPSRET